jgi:hypothetical protein
MMKIFYKHIFHGLTQNNNIQLCYYSDIFILFYAVWTVHCLNREKFENGEKTTRILYAYLRGKTALHMLEHSFSGSQQVHTKNFEGNFSKFQNNGECTKNDE